MSLFDDPDAPEPELFGFGPGDPLEMNQPGHADSFENDPSFVPLNLAWLDFFTRNKLLQQVPFMHNDWSKLMNAIFDNIGDQAIRMRGRRWYMAMSCHLIDRFPHLFTGMSTNEAIAFIKKKLRTKSRNNRYRVSHSKPMYHSQRGLRPYDRPTPANQNQQTSNPTAQQSSSPAVIQTDAPVG